jgi:uncharacterized protein
MGYCRPLAANAHRSATSFCVRRYEYDMNLRNISLITTFLYIAIMGIGMYVMHYIFGYSYGQPEMVYVISFFEVGTTALSLYIAKRYFGWKLVGFGKFRLNELWWFLPYLLFIGAILFVFQEDFVKSVDDLSSKQWGLLASVTFCTFLVGFSEELVFRGIILKGFLEKHGVFFSMLMSAVLFSLLHSVNVFGGMPFIVMLVQLIMTFLLGMVFAPLAIKLNNITPLILFHFIWDMLLFSSPIIGSSATGIAGFILFLHIAVGIPIWISLRKWHKGA